MDEVSPVTPSIAFELRLEHGLCVGVHLPDGSEAIEALAAGTLCAEERAFALGMSAARRRSWVGGRVALHQALERSGAAAGAIFADDRGAPALPAGIVGSISHKNDLAVALVARGTSARVGVDIEADAARGRDIASIVLAADELAELASLASPERAREVLLRFSAKEAIYKAIDPFVRRYVAFREVSVSPRADGSAEVRLRLAAPAPALSIESRWTRRQGFVLTTARVTPIG
jgi:4'-phosphopantetheinyl transferase EntD